MTVLAIANYRIYCISTDGAVRPDELERTMSLRATQTKLGNGTTGYRVDGICRVGDGVSLMSATGGGSGDVVTAVLWSGVARDGQVASLVTLRYGAPRKATAYSARYAPGRAGTAAYDNF